MSAADEAYKAAQEEIARVEASREIELRFDTELFRSLEVLPTEISELTALEILDLVKTQVSDLEPIRNLAELRIISLDTTPVANLEPICELLNLQALSFAQTRFVTSNRSKVFQHYVCSLWPKRRSLPSTQFATSFNYKNSTSIRRVSLILHQSATSPGCRR